MSSIWSQRSTRAPSSPFFLPPSCTNWILSKKRSVSTFTYSNHLLIEFSRTDTSPSTLKTWGQEPCATFLTNVDSSFATNPGFITYRYRNGIALKSSNSADATSSGYIFTRLRSSFNSFVEHSADIAALKITVLTHLSTRTRPSRCPRPRPLRLTTIAASRFQRNQPARPEMSTCGLFYSYLLLCVTWKIKKERMNYEKILDEQKRWKMHSTNTPRLKHNLDSETAFQSGKHHFRVIVKDPGAVWLLKKAFQYTVHRTVHGKPTYSLCCDS